MSEVRILGSIAVGNDEGDIALGGPRQRRLLAALVLHEGEVVSVDRMADIVFEEHRQPQHVERAISTYVSRLRKTLGQAGYESDCLERVDHGYVLRLDDTADVRRFELLVEGARRQLDERDPVRAGELAKEALALWHGRPFADLADEPWSRAEVARLEELQIVAEEIRIEALIAREELGAASAELDGLVERHPYRESARELQMLVLYRAGRQVDALATYHQFRDVLNEELGLEPGPELQRLEHRILEQDPTLSDSKPSRPLRSYRLGDLVAEGHWGRLYRGVEPALGRDVAVRIIDPRFSNDPDFIRSFEVEAARVAKLDHPHILPLDDYWRDSDGAYLVTRWHGGGTGADLLAAGSQPEDDVVRILHQAASAVGAAHTAGLCHMDIRPENVLFDDFGNTYVADFAVSAAAGTPPPTPFVAPEVTGTQSFTPPADVYSLGRLACALLAGDAEAGPAAVDGVQNRLAAVLKTATAVEPGDRHQSAGELATALEPLTGAPLVGGVDAPNPYRGLQPFGETDASVFAGRTALVGELVSAIGSTRLTSVVGPSGCGKSSVIWAGVVPALRSGTIDGSETWVVAGCTPGAHPFEELEAALLRVAVNPPPSLLEQLLGSERGLSRAVKRILPDGASDLLLVIDQFEELFTASDDVERTNHFLGSLIEAVDDPQSRLRVVLSLRADFYDRPLANARFGPWMASSVVNVPAMAPDELAEAISEPALRAGCTVEPELVARITADVQDRPGALPLVQYAMTEIFERRSTNTLTIESYRAIGGIGGAMVGRADALLAELGDDDRARARRIFTRMVALGDGTEDTRRRVRLAELAELPDLGERAGTILGPFGAHRLVTFDNDPISRTPTVEIAHEALIREWGTLRSWLDEDRVFIRVLRQLDGAAEAWQSGGTDDGDLLRGARLEAVREWVEERPDEINETSRRFLGRSVEAAEAEEAAQRRSTRRLRGLLVAVAAALVVAVVAGAAALREQSKTAEARDEAVAARDGAELNRLVAEVNARAASDPSTALLLAVEANRQADTIETLGALQTALVSAPGFLGQLGTATYNDVEWHESGMIVAVTDDELHVWDPERRKLIAEFTVPASRLVDVALSDDGTMAAVADRGADGAASVITLATGEVTKIVTLTRERPTALAFNGDGSEILVATDQGRVLIRSSDSGEAVNEWRGATNAVTALARHPDASRVLVGSTVRSPASSGGIGGTPTLVEFTWEGEQLGASDFGRSGFAAVVAYGADNQVAAADSAGTIVAGSELRRGGLLRATAVDDEVLDLVFLSSDDLAIVTRQGMQLVNPRSPLAGRLLPAETVLIRASSHAADGGRWVTTAPNRGLSIRSLTGDELLAAVVVSATGEGFGTSSATSDGERLAVADARAGAELWAFEEGQWTRQEPLLEPQPGGSDRPAVGASIDDDLLVIRDGLNHVQVLDPWTLEPLGPRFRLRSGARDSSAVAANRARNLVAIGISVENKTDLYDFTTGEHLGVGWVQQGSRGQPGCDEVSTLSFTPDGNRLVATACEVAGIEWNLRATEESPVGATSGAGTSLLTPIREFADVSITADWAQYSPDGRWFLTSTTDGLISIRDPETWTEQARLVGHQRSAHVSVDADRLVTSSIDGTVRLWSADDWSQIGSPLRTVQGFEVTGSGSPGHAITASDGHVVVWDLDPTNWISSACRAAGRNLTRAEWEAFGPADPYRATCDQWPIET